MVMPIQVSRTAIRIAACIAPRIAPRIAQRKPGKPRWLFATETSCGWCSAAGIRVDSGSAYGIRTRRRISRFCATMRPPARYCAPCFCAMRRKTQQSEEKMSCTVMQLDRFSESLFECTVKLHWAPTWGGRVPQLCLEADSLVNLSKSHMVARRSWPRGEWSMTRNQMGISGSPARGNSSAQAAWGITHP